MDPDAAAGTVNEIGVVGTLAIVILILAALLWVAYRNINDKLASVNKAVNNSPAGDPTMVERVKRIESTVDKLDEWFDEFNRNGWTALPSDLANAGALADTIRVIQRRMEELHSHDSQTEAKLDLVLKELREHVEWEMQAKYGLRGSE